MSLIGITILSFITIAIVTIYQYRNQSRIYHNERLLRKEQQLAMQLRYVFSQTTFPVEDKYIPVIFREEIYRIADIENINFNLYTINGTFLISSQAGLRENKELHCIPDSILTALSSSVDKRLVFQAPEEGGSYQYSYSYVNDLQYKPLLIVHIPHFENDTFNEGFLQDSLYNLGSAYGAILLLTIVVALVISRYITRSLKEIQHRLRTTHFLGKNEKINVKNTTTEIGELIFSYNEMVDEIEKSKKALAKIEREKMWKDMAKQIAHEIKNPLTPMRLSVQNFERRFTPEDPQCREKVANFTQMLLQHIDLPYIHFESSQETIELCVDRNQMNRMLTNLLKNALYATDSTPTPLIEVTSFIEGNYAYIVVKDNGSGVPIELQERIFEPKFTTKNTAGSGLGLAMVKHIVSAHAGEITLSSEVGKGASFTIKLSGGGQETNL